MPCPSSRFYPSVYRYKPSNTADSSFDIAIKSDGSGTNLECYWVIALVCTLYDYNRTAVKMWISRRKISFTRPCMAVSDEMAGRNTRDTIQVLGINSCKTDHFLSDTTYLKCSLFCLQTQYVLFQYSDIYPTRCNVTQLILPGNCCTFFWWYHHPSSGARTTVSTASGICHTVTAICRYRGSDGTGLSVLWVAYATHSALKPVSR